MQIELTKNQALTLATLSAFNSRDKWTPVLTETLVTIADNKLTAMATDRFAAVKFTDDVIADDVEFRLTANLTKFLKANLVKAYKGNVMVFVSENSVTVELSNGASQTDVTTTAKFPALQGLFDGWSPAKDARAIAMKIELLARLEKIKLDGEFADLWHLETGVNPGNANKPGPVLATSAKSDNLVALVQPNLLVKERN
jgi:hypothetical protein